MIEVKENEKGILVVKCEELRKLCCFKTNSYDRWFQKVVQRFQLKNELDMFSVCDENGEFSHHEFSLETAVKEVVTGGYQSGLYEFLYVTQSQDQAKKIEVAKEQARAEFADVAKRLSEEILLVEQLKKEIAILKLENEKLEKCVASVSKVVSEIERGTLSFS